MANPTTTTEPSILRVKKNCPPEREINILLLGQTGTGKTTFINALANYLINDTLDEALDNNFKVVIPSSFAFTDPETFEEKIITIGKTTNPRSTTENGQSYTEQCRSFVFPLFDRNLRLIDTPGMGDTRGSEQDRMNLFEILSYISHYEHLNGICVFLKPSEERLTIEFRLCLRQILHYLHASVRENIIFIFTNARSTHYMPGSSKKLLHTLLNEDRLRSNLEIPFAKENTFLLENETFRYIGAHLQGIQFTADQLQTYKKSWDSTIKEYERLLIYVSKLPLHAVANTLSLSEAEQLIRKLPRPIAETLRLIEQNVQLAKHYRQSIIEKQRSPKRGLHQNVGQIVQYRHPKLVCVSKKCLEVIQDNNEKRVLYQAVCHNDSYLNGVVQETINEPKIAQCQVMNQQTGKCSKCNCSWQRHMHITYEYNTTLTYTDINVELKQDASVESQVKVIDRRINDLQREKEDIVNIYKKITTFLHLNAMHPSNDNMLDYLPLFIWEEQMKNKDDARNSDVIDGLKKVMSQYEEDMNVIKNTSADEKNSSEVTDKLSSENLFSLVGTLHRLPINGQGIREQINLLKITEDSAVRYTEKQVKLPIKAAGSRVMCTLKDLLQFESSVRL